MTEKQEKIIRALLRAEEYSEDEIDVLIMEMREGDNEIYDKTY